MVVSETLAEVGLAFAREPAWSAQAYAAGFDLRGWVDGESGQFRHSHQSTRASGDGSASNACCGSTATNGRTGHSALREEQARRASVRGVISGLTDAFHRNAGAPELADLFTRRVVDGWGGRDRYQKLLWLHTMLRPISGSGPSGDDPRFNPDGSADMRISVHHAPTHGEHGSTATLRVAISGGEQEPPPELDRAAIDRGEEHRLDLRLLPHGDGWLMDTDVLAIFVDRVGPIEHVVQPLSRQGSGEPPSTI